jgi:hypothetical protein
MFALVVRVDHRAHAFRGGRNKAALDPSSFGVDERDLVDLIELTSKFSRALGLRGVAGDWSRYFRGDGATIPEDISFLIAEMASVDSASEYQAKVGGLAANSDLTLDDVYDDLLRLDDWLQRADRAALGKAAQSAAQHLSGMLWTLVSGDNMPAYTSPSDLFVYIVTLPEWPRLLARRGGLGSQAWKTGEALDATSVNDKFTNLQMYGLVNRTAREIAIQARGLLGDSLNAPDHAPQVALMLTFLQLYQRVQADINGVTARHLDFYYKDILKFTPRPAQPDTALVCFTLAPGTASLSLPSGLALNGGMDAQGKPIVYALDEETRLDEAAVVRFSSLTAMRDGDGETLAVYTRPVANSADGFGAVPAPSGVAWPAFVEGPDATAAEMGIRIRSPILQMRAGARRFSATLQFEAADALAARLKVHFARTRDEMAAFAAALVSDEQILARAFRLAVETPAGELEVAFTLSLAEQNQGRIVFTATLAPGDPPLLGAQPGAAGPSLRIALRGAGATLRYPYSCFAGLALTGVDLEVEASNVAPLVVRGPLGAIDATKPFSPFGPQALVGAALVFSHPDLFGKPITRLQIDLGWSGLPAPPQTLELVYASYTPPLTREDFCGRVSRLSNCDWEDIAPVGVAGVAEDLSFPLFDQGREALLPVTSRVFDFSAKPFFAPLADSGGLGPATAAGYYRLVLTSPPVGFGQLIYPQLLVAAATNKIMPPPPPLAPITTSFSASYSARLRLDLQRASAELDDGRTEGVFAFAPFGVPEPSHPLAPFPLLPHQGCLMLGLANAETSGELSLVFHLAVGAADFVRVARASPDAGNPAAPTWRYLGAKGWKDLPATAVTLDTTLNLMRSGLVRLATPDDARLDASGLIWLQIAVDKPARLAWLYEVRCGGARATRSSAAGIAPWVQPAGAIAALLKPNGKIAGVAQLFATEDGAPAEDIPGFRARVSERLRHKQRAISPLDFETHTLAAFPEIGDAKCLTAAEANIFGARPGEVVIVVAPVRDGAGNAATLPPARLDEIGTYLLARSASSVAAVIVRNPAYERVRVSAWFDFPAGDLSVYWRAVRQAIDDCIALWRADPARPLAIGEYSVDLTSMRACLERLDCVRGVKGLSLVHIFDDPGPATPSSRNAEPFLRLFDTAVSSSARAIRGRWPWSVLLPASDHQLHLQSAAPGLGALAIGEDFAIADTPGENPTIARRAGVGDLVLGLDLLVKAGIDHIKIGGDFRVA